MAYTKQQKKVMSRIMGKGQADPEALLEIPLTDGTRRMYGEDSITEYGFLIEVGDETDEEIDEFFKEHVWRSIPSHMHWDCTGCLFTWSIRWHRNPSGLVSFVHRMGIDN